MQQTRRYTCWMPPEPGEDSLNPFTDKKHYSDSKRKNIPYSDASDGYRTDTGAYV